MKSRSTLTSFESLKARMGPKLLNMYVEYHAESAKLWLVLKTSSSYSDVWFPVLAFCDTIDHRHELTCTTKCPVQVYTNKENQ